MKELYEHSERQFNDELDRETAIHKKAQIYFTLGSFILTALLFKIKDLHFLMGKTNNLCFARISLFCSLILIFSSLVYIGWSIRMLKYEIPTKNETILEEAKANIALSKFYSHRISDYLYATQKNRETNNKRAKKLKTALVLLLFGYFSTLTFIITILL